MNRPMTEAEREQARRDYQADPDVSVQQLADEYGVSRSAMLRALAGITRPRGGQVKARLSTEQMRRMYHDQGLTLRTISEQAGITESAVWYRLYRRREAVS